MHGGEDADVGGPVPGGTEAVAPGILRVLAPNPSPMTAQGTNTYLLGTGPEVAVIDPGPDDERHLAAILEAAGGRRVAAIFVTHAHRDHSELAPRLAAATGAEVAAFGDACAGRSVEMTALAARGLTGGEGVDTAFRPHRRLADGAQCAGAGWSLIALWTPGHMANHMTFLSGGAAFSGDLVMGWATSLISPPDGDLADFRTSCARLREAGAQVLWPGHGPPVRAPAARIDALLAHREMREAQIRSALADAPGTAAALAERIYLDTPRALLPAAARNVLAHLLDLAARGLAQTEDAIGTDAVYRPTGRAEAP